MTQIAHIFTPKDSSFSERIRAYKKAIQELRNIEASMKLANDKEWSNRLGDKQELEEAHSIIQHSVKIAHQEIGKEDLSKAQEQGLFDDSELAEVIRMQRQQKIKATRTQQSQSSANQHKL